jgi:hypothetical protein
MAEQQNIEGVDVNRTGNKDMRKEYAESDVEVLFRRGEWRNWDDAINWLEQNGDSDNELTPGETIAMKEDLSELRKRGEKFFGDPRKVYDMTRRHRPKE